MNNSFLRLIAFFSAFNFLLVSFGFLEFSLWDQVLFLHSQDVGVLDLYGHPHQYRYIAVYPAFFISDFFKLPHDLVFSFMCVGLLSIIIYFSLLGLKLVSGIVKFQSVFMLILFYFLMSIFVNGRGLFSLLSASIFIYIFISFHKGIKISSLGFFLVPISLLLSSVSSGTFLLIYLLYFLLMVTTIARSFVYGRIYSRNVFWVFYIFCWLTIFSHLLILFLVKNLNYYEGVINMLEHGFGVILLRVGVFELALILIIIAIIGLLTLIICRSRKHLCPLWMLACVSLVSGLFGKYTAAMALVPLLIVLVDFVNATSLNIKFRKNKI